MSEFHRSEREVVQSAHCLGLIAVFPRDNELMLDIDRPYAEDIQQLLTPSEYENFSIVSEHIKIKHILVTRSKSGRAHVYMQIDRELKEFERISLQACLGSDTKREILSALRRLAKGRASVTTVLFENTLEFMRVDRWRRKTKASEHRFSFGDVVQAAAMGWHYLTGKDL